MEGIECCPIAINYSHMIVQLYIRDIFKTLCLLLSYREMYWIERLQGTGASVVKSSMDASSRVVISSTERPTAVFIDFLTETLYWTDDTQSNSLGASNLDGSSIRTVIDFSSLGFSFSEVGLSIFVHNNNLYYVGNFLGVAVVNIQTLAGKFLYDSGCNVGNGIQIVSEQRQLQGS